MAYNAYKEMNESKATRMCAVKRADNRVRACEERRRKRRGIQAMIRVGTACGVEARGEIYVRDTGMATRKKRSEQVSRSTLRLFGRLGRILVDPLEAAADPARVFRAAGVCARVVGDEADEGEVVHRHVAEVDGRVDLHVGRVSEAGDEGGEADGRSCAA